MGPLTVCLMGACPLPPARHIRSGRVWGPVAGVHRAMFVCHKCTDYLCWCAQTQSSQPGTPGPSLSVSGLSYHLLLPKQSREVALQPEPKEEVFLHLKAKCPSCPQYVCNSPDGGLLTLMPSGRQNMCNGNDKSPGGCLVLTQDTQEGQSCFS